MSGSEIGCKENLHVTYGLFNSSRRHKLKLKISIALDLVSNESDLEQRSIKIYERSAKRLFDV